MVVASQGYPLILQSNLIQGDIEGTAHANHAGQLVYRTVIPDAVYRGTTPTTTAQVDEDGGQSSAKHSVTVTLRAETSLAQAGIGATYYAIDNPSCTPTSRATCSSYTGPFTVAHHGSHTVSFFSVNRYGTAEDLHAITIHDGDD